MKICVIGAGVAGLTAAYELGKEGNDVIVIEKDDSPGGQAASFEIGGYQLDRFYHHVFTGDQYFHRQIDELGLTDDMMWLRSRMGVYHGDRIRSFGTPLDLLRYSPLPLIDRIRFGLVVLKLQRLDDWHPLEDIKAMEWISANASDKILEVIWGPLLRGKFGEKADQVAMSWLWNKIKLRGDSRSKGGGVEKLGYLKGGFQRAMDALVDKINTASGEVRLSREVSSLSKEQNGFVVKTAAGETIKSDKVLVTTPTPIFLKLCAELPTDYKDKLSTLSYQAAQTLVFSCRRSLSDIYWLNVTEPGFPFIGVIEHTNYVSSEHYGGQNLVYISNYLDASEPAYSMSADNLLRHYLPYIQKINPDFSLADVADLHMFKDPHGQPVIFTGYRDYLPKMETPLSGLYLANTSQIYPEDRGINFSIRLGQQAAKAILVGQKKF